MKKAPAKLLPWALALGLSSVHAGRPLGTDDATTAAASNCQVEAWAAHSGGHWAAVLAPACGVSEGLEVDSDLILPAQQQVPPMGADLAVKWVPAALIRSTALGELALGIKGNQAFLHPKDADWRRASSTALLLASLQPNPQWALHLNLGRSREPQSGQQASLLNLAATWAPTESALLFAEVQTNSHPSLFGATLRTTGGRWWLNKDTLGLDLTVGRTAGAGASTQLTLGLGWYGLAY